MDSLAYWNGWMKRLIMGIVCFLLVFISECSNGVVNNEISKEKGLTRRVFGFVFSEFYESLDSESERRKAYTQKEENDHRKQDISTTSQVTGQSILSSTKSTETPFMRATRNITSPSKYSRLMKNYHSRQWKHSNSKGIVTNKISGCNDSCPIPPDHVSDGRLRLYYTEFKKNETQKLNSFQSAVNNELFQYNEFKNSLLKKEKPIAFSRYESHIESIDVKPESSLLRHDNDTVIKKFIGNKQVNTIYTNTNPKYPLSSDPYDVTCIFVMMINRLFLLQTFLLNWKGPASVVVYVTQEEASIVEDYINTHDLPSRLILLLYIHPSSNIFPINTLRNLAIRNIETTHFLIQDSDLLISNNSYSELMTIPSSIYNSTSAVILPTFFLNGTLILPHCSSLENCASLDLKVMPATKKDLIACLISGVCQPRKQYYRTHLYITIDWYDKSNGVTPVDCFLTDYQEPYVMLAYRPDTPLFDERFVNYGYNKMQLFEHLRAANYKFYLINNAFSVDLLHPLSRYRKEYVRLYLAKASPMGDLFQEFHRELNRRYPRSSPRTKICSIKIIQ